METKRRKIAVREGGKNKLFETTEICLGLPKWKFLPGKSISRWEKLGKVTLPHHPLKNIPLKGPYADHILIPQGSTGSSIIFDIK